MFRKIYPGYEPNPETIICDGCSSEKEHPELLDPSCKTRKCVNDKGLPHCGYCNEFPCAIFPAEPSDNELRQKIEVEHLWSWEEEKLMEAYQCKKNIEKFKKDYY